MMADGVPEDHTIRVVVAASDAFVRSAVSAYLMLEPDIEFVAKAVAEPSVVISILLAVRPDVLVLVSEAGDRTAPRVIDGLQRRSLLLPVLVLSRCMGERGVTPDFAAGYRGRVSVFESIRSLPWAVRTTVREETDLSLCTEEVMLAAGTCETERLQSHLTRSELAILRLLARGYTNTQIAEELCVARQTARNYASRVIQKLGMRSRGEALLYAVKHGVGDQPEIARQRRR